MGLCCSGITNSEENIIKYLSPMKIRQLTMKEIKLVLIEESTLNLSEDYINKLSKKSLTTYEEIKNKISEENFDNIINELFVDIHDENRRFQIEYLKKLFEISKNRFSLLFNLFSLTKINNDSPLNFLILLTEMNQTNEITYKSLKQHFFTYIKTNLINPLIFYQSFTKRNDIKQELEYIIQEQVEEEAIYLYMNSLLEKYEQENFINVNEGLNNMIIDEAKIEVIFKQPKKFFDIIELRRGFFKFIRK